MRCLGPECQRRANSGECTVGPGKSGLDGVGSLLDDSGSLLDVLGSLLGSKFFFSIKTLFSERGMAKTQLNFPQHASKWGPKMGEPSRIWVRKVA